MTQIDITDADRSAAHQLLTELRTRISTQPLPYQYGIESRALESMWEVFSYAREAIKANPGCARFAAMTTEVLNGKVRPLTSKWHRAHEDGRLKGRDGADEFRGELKRVQSELRAFAETLHEMAYSTASADKPTPEAMGNEEIETLLSSLRFGFSNEQIAKMEAEAVNARRHRQNPANNGPAGPLEPAQNAIGLALSGGGIRSATFSLGVVQVLAQKGFLKEVDFLSTVSGGGYTGCFLTQQLGTGNRHSEVATPHGPDSVAVRYLRQHARFLSGDNLRERWAMLTATLAGMLLNWTGPVFVIAALALVTTFVGPQVMAVRPLIFAVAAGLSALAMIAYAVGMRRGKKATALTGRILGGLIAFTGLVGAGWGLDLLFSSILENSRGDWSATAVVGAVVSFGAVAVPAMIRFLPVLENPKMRKLVLKLALILAGLVVPLMAVLLFYIFVGIGQDHLTALGLSAAVLAAVSIFAVNINLNSPHRLYRDGLARTFIQKSTDGTPEVDLKAINPDGTAPYHILNATLNIPNSESASLKDRGCDFFMFSKYWTGSDSTGYRPTADWKVAGAELDLATAMAVSGAAVSSYMGLGSMPTLTALLTLLNVRLGFWIRKPSAARPLADPGFMCLLRETLGTGMSEHSDWLNLSDGGHIENLAIYELLRRRCKFVICVDGEADPDYTFQGVMTLVRHAQIDLGVRISPRLDDLRPDAQTGFSKCHSHFCRIDYPCGGQGLLLYIKLSVTGNESELIRRYRTNNPIFPHQSTLDQFFDQEQFEAYRQLGVHAAEGLFLPALMDETLPASVHDWFKQLAKSLLEPSPAAIRPTQPQQA